MKNLENIRKLKKKNWIFLVRFLQIYKKFNIFIENFIAQLKRNKKYNIFKKFFVKCYSPFWKNETNFWEIWSTQIEPPFKSRQVKYSLIIYMKSNFTMLSNICASVVDSVTDWSAWEQSSITGVRKFFLF